MILIWGNLLEMKSNKTILAIALLVLATFALSAAFYNSVPAMMASHWNSAGEANGTMSRFWGLFLTPLISLGFTALLLAIPKIDPLKANIQKFQGYYYGFIVVFLVYFLYIHLLTLLWNVGWRFNFSQAIIPSMGFLMFFLGVLLGKAKRNYFIGIRTPWTLSNDEVWEKTHRLGGTLFKIAGVVIILLVFVPVVAVYALLVLIFGVALCLIIYSYLVYRSLGLPPQPPVGR